MVFSKFNIFLMLAGLMAAALSPAVEPAMSMTVEQAVDEALSQNPVIQQHVALEAAAGFDVASARKDLLPKAVTAYSYTGLDRAPVMKQAGSTMQIAHRNQFHWEVAVVQPLFTGFARVLGLEQTKLKKQYVREETRMAVLDLTHSVKKACYAFLLARKTDSVAKDEVAALSAHAKDAKRFYEQGLIPRNDLLRSEVGLAAAVQQAERAGADEKIAASMVNSLLNRDAVETVDLSDIAVTIEDAPAFDPLFARALANRPVLLLLKNTVTRLEVEERLAKSPRYPRVNLVAGYAKDGDGPAVPPAGGQLFRSPGRQGLSDASREEQVQLGIRLPVGFVPARPGRGSPWSTESIAGKFQGIGLRSVCSKKGAQLWLRKVAPALMAPDASQVSTWSDFLIPE